MAHRICKRQLWIVSGRVVVEMKKSTYQTLKTDIMPQESTTNENFGKREPPSWIQMGRRRDPAIPVGLLAQERRWTWLDIWDINNPRLQPEDNDIQNGSL